MIKKVKLIACTEPTEESRQEFGMKSSEDIITYCARVSNPNNQTNFETGSKLLKYLINNKHWSPLEMVDVVFELNTTRTIGRQILRHKSFVFQEFSQRYAEVITGNFIFSEARLQDNKNRQNSIEVNDDDLNNQWYLKQLEVAQASIEAYNWALSQGIAKEVARVVLPEGLTPSRMYMKGSLRSWLHYSQLRMGNGTQKEHREIASEIWNELKTKYPILGDFDEKQMIN